MTDEDAAPFAELIAAARAAFNQPVDTAVGALYWRVLRPFDLDDVRTVVDRQLATADRMPAPGALAGDLRDLRKRRHLEAQTAKYLAEPAPRFALPAPKPPTQTKPKRLRLAARRETEDEARQRLAAQAAELGITREQIDDAMETAR